MATPAIDRVVFKLSCVASFHLLTKLRDVLEDIIGAVDRQGTDHERLWLVFSPVDHAQARDIRRLLTEDGHPLPASPLDEDTLLDAMGVKDHIIFDAGYDVLHAKRVLHSVRVVEISGHRDVTNEEWHSLDRRVGRVERAQTEVSKELAELREQTRQQKIMIEEQREVIKALRALIEDERRRRWTFW